MNTVAPINVAFSRAAVALYPTHDRVVWHHVNDAGGFEPETRKAWARAIRPGSCALDVGAYTGLYAIAAVKLGAARAVAIEPVPANQERLYTNIRINRVSGAVDIVRMAASDVRGVTALWQLGTNPLPSGAAVEKHGSMHAIGRAETFPLDDLDLRDVSVIKIDAERNELKVLAGLRATIERERPIIIIEDLDGQLLQILDSLKTYRFVTRLDRANYLLAPQ